MVSPCKVGTGPVHARICDARGVPLGRLSVTPGPRRSDRWQWFGRPWPGRSFWLRPGDTSRGADPSASDTFRGPTAACGDGPGIGRRWYRIFRADGTAVGELHTRGAALAWRLHPGYSLEALGRCELRFEPGEGPPTRGGAFFVQQPSALAASVGAWPAAEGM